MFPLLGLKSRCKLLSIFRNFVISYNIAKAGTIPVVVVNCFQFSVTL
ncbi:Hypothetical protein Ccan_14610 [Capnocytophaga canimorsus Cc5]|uniref:Uncharacterized protein n=1 Tax=Capnocytophaga canimorsus (strain 5) TaxID=860228 RepID=F9YQN8_CAPCC|nr:Hypothetical protein Ccan_14610 [Capnocytophaga canimorsus Cc5]